MNYCCLDTETTGTPGSPWARVVEIGAVAFTDGALELGTFSSLMCPDVLDDRALKALAYNGIDYEIVANAPVTSVVRGRLREWMDTFNVGRVFAYNAIFDQVMLERSDIYLPWAGCIMQEARVAMGVSKAPTLTAAAEHFRIPVTDKHRALVDARVAAAVLHRIRRSP